MWNDLVQNFTYDMLVYRTYIFHVKWMIHMWKLISQMTYFHLWNWMWNFCREYERHTEEADILPLSGSPSVCICRKFVIWKSNQECIQVERSVVLFLGGATLFAQSHSVPQTKRSKTFSWHLLSKFFDYIQ